MELTVTNFCCYHSEPRSFYFSPGKVTLIDGPSGIGKSTVLEAIYWVLYGKRRNVVPHLSKKNSRSEVTLRLGNLVVHRANHPATVEVVVNGQRAEGQPAQAYIDDVFGSAELWKCTAYLDQRGGCELLTASGPARVAILNRLVFKGRQSPDEYIDRILTQIAESKASLNSAHAREAPRIADLQRSLQGITVPPPPPRPLETVRAELSLCEEFVGGKKQLYQQHKQRQATRGTLREQLERVLAEIKTLPSHQTLSAELELLNGELAIWETHRRLESLRREFPTAVWSSEGEPPEENEEQLRATISRLRSALGETDIVGLESRLRILDANLAENRVDPDELLRINDQLAQLGEAIEAAGESQLRRARREELLRITEGVPPDEISPVDLEKAEQHCARVQNNMALLEKIGVPYEPQSILAARREAEGQLERARHHHGLLAKHSDLTRAVQELEQLGDVNLAANAQDLYRFEQQLRELDRVHYCVNCHFPMRLEEDHLVAAETNIPPAERQQFADYVERYRHEVPRAERARELQHLISTLRQEIPPTFDPVSAENENLERLMRDVTTLREIVYVAPLVRTLGQLRAIDELARLGPPEENFPDPRELTARKEILWGQRAILQEKNRRFMADHTEREKLSHKAKTLEELRRVEEKLARWAAGWCRANVVQPPARSREELLAARTMLSEQLSRLSHLGEQQTHYQDQLDANPVDEKFIAEYERHDGDLASLRSEYSAAQRAEELNSWRDELREKTTHLENLRLRLENLEKLKSKAIEVQSQYLSAAGRDLVDHTNHILRELFFDPITIEMSLVHTVKKTQSVISGLDWAVHYKGGTYHNLAEFSGGEGKRVSLALVLALQRLHNNQILLLDEVMSSVELELRTRCMDFIHQIAAVRNLIVVMINHVDTGGSIDETITIDRATQ